MQTTILGKGRLVISKTIQNALGMTSGALVDIEVSGASVGIKSHKMGNKTVNDIFGALSRYSNGDKMTEEAIEAASLMAARAA